jgi:hypothetical protein
MRRRRIGPARASLRSHRTTNLNVINDPEDLEMLAPYRDNDPSGQTIESSVSTFPGAAWYAAYQAAARAGDEERALELLERGAAARHPGAS